MGSKSFSLDTNARLEHLSERKMELPGLSGALKSKRSISVFVLCVVFVVVPYIAVFHASDSIYTLLSESSWSRSFHRVFGWGNTVVHLEHSFSSDELQELKRLLNITSFRNSTVIITTLNSAWAAEQSMIDLFLKSFAVGNGTRALMDHLLIVALDEAAYLRCRDIHKHCFVLKTDGVDFAREKFFMSSDYLKMMWRRIDFLRTVLELGYNFVFSDADILWLRDPFEHFSPDADFEIACDHYNGNPVDLSNRPNGGFVHAMSSMRTIDFYKLWYKSRLSFPGLHDQDVLNQIKFTPEFSKLKLNVRFLSTEIFGEFCEISRSKPETVCTVHANCCKGLKKKLKDLRGIIRDWIRFKSLSSEERKSTRGFQWSPLKCPKRKRNVPT